MQKSVSVKDIAQKLNISLSTVHKALSGKSGISEKRRKEVLETACEMGYVVNSVAQSLARKDINVGIFMPSKWQEYFEGMKKGIEQEIENLKKYKVRGFFYYLSSKFLKEDVENATSWLKENGIDVIIYCPSIYSLNAEFFSEIKKLRIPVFLAGDSYEKIDSISNIVPNADLSGKIAADFLRCTKSEKLNAAVFTGSLELKPHKAKVDSFVKRTKSFGGKVDYIFETHDDPDKAYKYMQEVCRENINAIYVATATSAPVCKYIEENNLSGEVALICTDIFDKLKYYMKKNIVKATIYQNQEKVGSMAVKSAYEYLVKKNSYGNEKMETEERIYIRPSLFLLADIE